MDQILSKRLLYTLLGLFLFVFAAFGQQKSGEGVDSKSALSAAKENYNKGNYPEAMSVALSAYGTGQKLGDKALTADAGNLIGLVDLAQGKPGLALDYFRTAMRLNREVGNMKRVAANLINIGLAYSDLKKLDSAVISLKASLEISERLSVKNLEAMGHNHLGDMYFRQGNLVAAEAQFRNVLDDKTYPSDWENSFASAGISKVLFAKKDFPGAADFADRAYALALKAEAKWDAARAMDLAHRAYRAMGEMPKAYDRLLTYKTYSDSLFNADREKELNAMRLRAKSIENENLQSHIKLVAQQRSIERLVMAVTAIVLILLVTFAVLIYLRHRRSVSKNRLLQAENDSAMLQKELFASENQALNLVNQDHNRLFSIIGHDLRSPFNSISHTLALFRSGLLDQQDLLQLTERLQTEVGTASGMLNSLLVWSANQMGGIRFKPIEVDLKMKVNRVVESVMPMALYKKIRFVHEPSGAALVFVDADQVRIMIHNLVSNAIKFTPEGGTIRVYYEPSADHIDLIIQDSGVGMPADKLDQILSGTVEHCSTYGTKNEKGIGLGLHFVREFADNNKAALMAESTPGKGSRFILRFQRFRE